MTTPPGPPAVLVRGVQEATPLPAGGVGLRHYGDSAEWISRYDVFRRRIL